MIRKKVGVLGSGIVGRVLAAGFHEKGYSTMIGTRNGDKLSDWLAENKEIESGTFEDAAAYGDILVLALRGLFAEDVVANINPDSLNGKTILDATNPIADKPPVNGVLTFFTEQNHSLMESLQAVAPTANFVKCFSCVPNLVMVDPDFGDTTPTMFICGNHGGAKIEARNILDRFGWDVEDLGSVEAARAIESLAILACIRGFNTNNWRMAFKLLL